jgi:hypothetical protein
MSAAGTAGAAPAPNGAGMAQQAANLRATVELSAKLPRIDYELQRNTIAEAFNIRVTVLDDLVDEARKNASAKTGTNDNAAEIARLNKQFALVKVGKKVIVMLFNDDDGKKFDLNVIKPPFDLMDVKPFEVWMANQTVSIGGMKNPAADFWLTHPDRRQYQGIEFAPPGAVESEGYYNLWRGFAVTPKKGNWSLFRAHLLNNIAQGNEHICKWIIAWRAWIAQKPSVKSETAVAVVGIPGCGKTKVGEVFGSLFGTGRHHLLVKSPRLVTGNFNSHMAHLLVLQCEEAFWAGNKEAEGAMKDLISGKTHMLEFKGVDPISIRNFLRVFATSNEDWVVPANFGERRWAVFKAGSAQANNREYFAAIDAEMNNGGREALLYHLLHEVDLSKDDPTIIPLTDALLHQKKEHMSPEEAWWFETLNEGWLPAGCKDGGVQIRGVCNKAYLYEGYLEHVKTTLGLARRKKTKDMLGKDLAKFGAKNYRPRDGEGKRTPYYEFPPLKECRETFATMLGQPIDWGSVDWQKEEWQHTPPYFPHYASQGASGRR